MGMVHLYCGDGKGKTTAAVGLAVRFAGNGGPVVFSQYLKPGNSSELAVLRGLEQVSVLVCDEPFGFYKNMTDEVREKARASYSALFRRARDLALAQGGLLVLDELCAACRYGLVPKEEVLALLRQLPEDLEVVITGRDPDEALLQRADYITEMKKLRHPFDQGIYARKGVEY
ncbi:MAG: cob(I)yrinic acid a,c-diamide adenosyltransferase [Firmicutes bacterium]|nr:cob(I)yrinic acid a,c-diamide adenosyltransferase [Bacillota bacterium]